MEEKEDKFKDLDLNSTDFAEEIPENENWFFYNSLNIQIIGFVLLLISLVVMFLARSGTLPPLGRIIAVGLTVLAIILYFVGRVLTFIRKKRKN